MGLDKLTPSPSLVPSAVGSLEIATRGHSALTPLQPRTGRQE